MILGLILGIIGGFIGVLIRDLISKIKSLYFPSEKPKEDSKHYFSDNIGKGHFEESNLKSKEIKTSTRDYRKKLSPYQQVITCCCNDFYFFIGLCVCNWFFRA